MPLASGSYSYPVLGAFWTIFMIFLWEFDRQKAKILA